MSDNTTPPEGGSPDSTPEQPDAPQLPPAYGSEVPPPPPSTPAPPTGFAGGGSGYSPVEAIKYGWGKFTASPSSVLIPALVLWVVLVVVNIVFYFLLRATLLDTHSCNQTVLGVTVETTCGPGFIVSLIGNGLLIAVSTFVELIFGAGVIKSALNVVDHKPTNVGDVFGYAFKSNVLGTAAIVAGATGLGFLLCYLPGVVIGFLTVFAMYYAVDKDLPATDAIKASFALTTGNLGDTILFYLLGGLTLFVGAVLCLVGLLAAIPVVLVGAAYTYRFLNNEPVTPVDAR